MCSITAILPVKVCGRAPLFNALTEPCSLVIPVYVVLGVVFIIAATNRPDLLDPALLRPGRLDRRIYLGVNKTVQSRLSILQAQTRSYFLHSGVDLLAVVQAMSDNKTGADIGAVCNKAVNMALQRKIAHVQSLYKDSAASSATADDILGVKQYLDNLSSEDLRILITQDDFLNACKAIKPSVVDLSYYEGLEKAFDNTK